MKEQQSEAAHYEGTDFPGPLLEEQFPQFPVTTEAARPSDIASTLGNVRQILAQVAAFAHAKVDLINQAIPTEDSEARRRRKRLVYLIQATAEAIDDARETSDQLAAELITCPADADV